MFKVTEYGLKDKINVRFFLKIPKSISKATISSNCSAEKW